MHLSPWLAMQPTKQLRDLAALARGRWVGSTGRGLLYILLNSSRDMEAARTIETSVITWHKTQDSTLNVYRSPNPNLQLCVAVSLYCALQAVVPRYRTVQMTTFSSSSSAFLDVGLRPLACWDCGFETHLRTCMFVWYECCVLSGRVLCDELITRPDVSYRMWCVVVYDLGTSWIRRP